MPPRRYNRQVSSGVDTLNGIATSLQELKVVDEDDSTNDVQNVKSADDNDQTIVIAVMGMTGAGKSSFIKLVTGDDNVKIGDTLTSETSEVCAYECYYKGTNYILVDTPGFDDTHRSESEITEEILTWLEASMVAGQRINGVIYLHRITDTRMRGTALRNIRMFRKLVGEDAFKNVILATTFWDQVNLQTGQERETELRENRDFWGGMVEKGAKIYRLDGKQERAQRLIEKIAKNNSKAVLQAQDEIVNQGKSIFETTAAREQKAEAERLERQLEAERQAERVRIQRQLEEERQRQAWKIEQEKMEMNRRLEAARLEAARLEAARLEDIRRRDQEREAELEQERRRNEEIESNRIAQQMAFQRTQMFLAERGRGVFWGHPHWGRPHWGHPHWGHPHWGHPHWGPPQWGPY